MNIKKVRSNAMLILTALIWGIAFVAQSVGMLYVGPFTFNAARFMIGGIVLVPVIFLLKKMDGQKQDQRSGEERAAAKKAGVIGGICCGLILFVSSSLQQFGVSYTTVGKAGFITALYIVMVPILGIFARKKVAVTVWISVIIATCGMYMLCMTGGLAVNKGDIYVFLCAIGFSFHILVIDFFSPKADGIFMSCVQFVTAGAVALVLAVLFESPTAEAFTAAWAPVLYAGVMSSGIGYTLQVVAQKDTDPVIASLLLSLESVFSLIAGWLILGQVLSFHELAGCVLVFCAIILAQLPKGLLSNRKVRPIA